MSSILEVKNVQVVYPNFKLDDISFECNKGEIIGVIGVNGAGKSTTIKSIMNIVKPQKGTIIWKGKELGSKDVSAFREEVGYVGDTGTYYPNIKVKKVLSFVSDIYSNWDYEVMQTMLSKFNIDVNKRIKELSTGMKVKLDLLIAMSHHAEIYILDEPTSGLDPVIRKEVIQILYDLAKKEQKAVIISSHITSDLEKIAERVLYIVDGKLELNISTKDIKQYFIKVNIEEIDAGVDLSGCLLLGRNLITTREIFDKRLKTESEINEERILLEDVLFYLGGY